MPTPGFLYLQARVAVARCFARAGHDMGSLSQDQPHSHASSMNAQSVSMRLLQAIDSQTPGLNGMPSGPQPLDWNPRPKAPCPHLGYMAAETMSQMAPRMTCMPWKPVVMKKVVP